jgi:hypothetical protein
VKPAPGFPEASYSMSRHVHSSPSMPLCNNIAGGRPIDWVHLPSMGEDKDFVRTADAGATEQARDVAPISAVK